jgi:hypothetical protein
MRGDSIWNVVTQQWMRPTGTFAIYIGASLKDVRLTGTFSNSFLHPPSPSSRGIPTLLYTQTVIPFPS